MRTNRGMVKTILLSLITGGIYGIWFWSTVGEDLNILAPNSKKTMHYCLVFFIFSWLTFGIVPLVWMHRISAKAGQSIRERGINYSFDASTFWLWNVLGSLIIVGPFVYLHKLCKAMNLLSADFNGRNSQSVNGGYNQGYQQPYQQAGQQPYQQPYQQAGQQPYQQANQQPYQQANQQPYQGGSDNQGQ